jgi:uncharacterized protein
MTETSGDVCALIEMIAKSLVDSPDEVFVEKFDDGVVELEVAENDVGKVIGRQGRTARALRTLLSAAGHRARRRYTLEIIE